MTTGQRRKLVLRHLTALFGLRSEVSTEDRHRLTGVRGTFYLCRIRSLKTGKLLIEVGGGENLDEVRRQAINMLLMDLGRLAASEPLPPQMDRKAWLRQNVIDGGKSETYDPAGEPGHGDQG